MFIPSQTIATDLLSLAQVSSNRLSNASSAYSLSVFSVSISALIFAIISLNISIMVSSVSSLDFFSSSKVSRKRVNSEVNYWSSKVSPSSLSSPSFLIISSSLGKSLLRHYFICSMLSILFLDSTCKSWLTSFAFSSIILVSFFSISNLDFSALLNLSSISYSLC